LFSPPSSSFPLNQNFLDQQSSSIDAGFDNDTVKAAQNILALLQETQFAADTEVIFLDLNFLILNDFFSLKLSLNMWLAVMQKNLPSMQISKRLQATRK
jgi:hypothetical protein